MSENIVTEALVNKKTGEVMEIGLQKTPEEIMGDAHGAAVALEKVIESNKRKPLEFNGKRFLEFPHWQTIGAFFHVSVSTGDPVYVEIAGHKGFKAKANVTDVKTGMQVGAAEAYCLTDEPNWRHKPLFQLASQAQTRAASKALSNKYRYVAILAGYEPTPGEEMDMSFERGLRAPKEKEAPAEIEFGGPESPPAAARAEVITEKQRKMLFARCREKGIPEDELKTYLWTAFQVEHSKDLARNEFDLVLKWIDIYTPPGGN
jgi:hypothetical protein